MSVPVPQAGRLPGPFRLGEWQILPSQNQLRREGGTVPLRPKVMDLLVVLAARPGEVVPAETIVAAVWGKRYLARSALPGAVSELREALGDDRREPRFVETVAKRGYRLAAPVSFEPEEGRADATSPRARVARPGVLALAGTALVALAFVGGAMGPRHLARGRLAAAAAITPDARAATGVSSEARELLETAVRVSDSSVVASLALVGLCAGEPAPPLSTPAGAGRGRGDGTRLHAMKSLLEAELLRAEGDAAAARTRYRAASEALAGQLAAGPADWHAHAAMAVALAGLGHEPAAVAEARRAVALGPVSGSLAARLSAQTLAEVQVRTGDLEGAVATLGQLAGGQGGHGGGPPLSRTAWWQPLARRADFQALLGRQPRTPERDDTAEPALGGGGFDAVCAP